MLIFLFGEISTPADSLQRLPVRKGKTKQKPAGKVYRIRNKQYFKP
ncbi:MAG: hypothetical protein HY738_14230 [Bacteroidia bacterium]|nr:hypothetical protein [Bacteroidia bacterium]